MPALSLLWLAVIGGAAWYLVKSGKQTVTAYKDGLPFQIEVKGIGNGATLRVDAADAFASMALNCEIETGQKLEASGPRAGFRTQEQQAALIAEEGSYSAGGLAAAVGKSPHQQGYAVDLNHCDPGKPSLYNQRLHEWVLANCAQYGFFNAGDHYVTKKEPWHYEFRPDLFGVA